MPSVLAGAGAGAALTAATAAALAAALLAAALSPAGAACAVAFAVGLGASLLALGAGARSTTGFSGSGLGFAGSGGATGSALASAAPGRPLMPELGELEAALGGAFPETSMYAPEPPATTTIAANVATRLARLALGLNGFGSALVLVPDQVPGVEASCAVSSGVGTLRWPCPVFLELTAA